MSGLSALQGLDERLQHDGRAVAVPRRKSFKEFMLADARVRTGGGVYGPYTFDGREALLEIVDTIDLILGSHTGKPLKDARMGVAGGAQFGKTILELNFGAYVTGQLFRNFGLYLPDDDLVQGIVDTKFRPDVVEQIDWFGQLVQVGKSISKSGRAVNRKGAFTVTDGRRRCEGMIRGLGKVPTTFSMDAAAMDEVDDIQPKMAKFVAGRLTASDLRFILEIGTQRIHGRGMNARWKSGSQGVVQFECGGCSKAITPEDHFPQIVRLREDPTIPLDQRVTTDPSLTYAADFQRDGKAVSAHSPDNVYYLACPHCSTPLDRSKPKWFHARPERVKNLNWSFKISQLSIPAIDLSQIVAGWTLAVADPEVMVVFLCDVLANPKSTSQKISPDILDRARLVEPYDMPPRVGPERVGYGGLDMGDMCWFMARESAPERKRVIAVEKIPAADVVARAPALFHRLGLIALFIDQRPSVNEARTIALKLNGLDAIEHWPKPPEGKDAYLVLPGGLTWEGRNQRWINLRCAVVRFDKKQVGAGIIQDLDIFQAEGQTRFVPVIKCNRYETIDRVVREFLTPKESVMEIVAGKMREDPAMLLPRRLPGSPPILETLDDHIVTGSEREILPDGTAGDYVDQCANHLLLSNGYSALAELVVAGAALHRGSPPILFPNNRRTSVLQERRDRTVMA